MSPAMTASTAINISGGTIVGDVDAETVILSGGTIGGNITGISGTTLVINDAASADPINLRNGSLISGVNAVGTIINSDLAAGGTKTQVFTGFDSVATPIRRWASAAAPSASGA